LEAVAKYNLYGKEKAEEVLLSAIDIGRADQIVLLFAEYGINILKLLKVLEKDLGNDEYLSKLVKCTEQYVANQKSVNSAHSAHLLLTKREKEILVLITDGKTNREIATTLFIAEVTVRKTITSIYRKLDATGRAAAVKKAIELKII
jgi:LuxR family maltose regulon positive regulatory protein